MTGAAQTLVAAAGLAPSIYNTQPWSFEIRGATIDLHADIDRALLGFVDPHERQLTISCGAALFNMRVAAAFIGRQLTVNLLPFPNVASLLASVTIGPRMFTRYSDAALYPAIRQRHTYRRGFLPREVPGAVFGELALAARREHAVLRVVGEGERLALLDLVVRSDAVLAGTSRYREELRQWTKGRASRLEGIPAGAYGTLPAGGSPPLRNFALADEAVTPLVERYSPDPCIAILATANDDRMSWLCAGQALQRVLLVACVRGLAASFLNQPLELEDVRRKLLPAGTPQMILRVGYPSGSVITPRRSLGDLISPLHRDPRVLDPRNDDLPNDDLPGRGVNPSRCHGVDPSR
jgi:hypothetical protein